MENRGFRCARSNPDHYTSFRLTWLGVYDGHLVIIFLFEYQQAERMRRSSEKKTGRRFCPLFVKLYKREFSFLIASHFEYIFHNLPVFLHFFLMLGRETLDNGLCLVVVFFALRFFADRSVELLIFVFPRHQPLHRPPSRFFLSSWETLRENGNDDEREAEDSIDAERFSIFFLSILLSFPTPKTPRSSSSSLPCKKLSRTWDATSVFQVYSSTAHSKKNDCRISIRDV